ncbi:MAG: GAF domain-containing protein, partial [Acidobacteriota bacterium]
ALTSDRPYRPAMSAEAAIALVGERRGTMYDPRVVDAFVRICGDLTPPARPAPALVRAIDRIRKASAYTPPPDSTAPPSLDVPANGPDELLAFVSLARLASGTPTVADVGALAWAHIRHLVPGATLAIYTRDDARHALVARFAAGPAASCLQGRVVGVGERLTGWVAANGRAVINSDARLDLADAPDDVRIAVALPLVVDGAAVGVMTLYAAEPLSADRSRMLEMITPHLALAMASATAGDGEAVPVRPPVAVRARSSHSALRVIARS